MQLGPFFWIEDLVAVVERSASCDVYALLKREDEKYVTEKAYDNPRFVEDLVREVYVGLLEKGAFPRFRYRPRISRASITTPPTPAWSTIERSTAPPPALRNRAWALIT